MSQRVEFDVHHDGFPIRVTVGGDEELDPQALAELRDVVVVAARWASAHRRFIRIPKVPALPGYEPLPSSLPGEIWRPIPGFVYSHEASNRGRIRSISRIVTSGHPSTFGGPQIDKPVRGRVLKTRVRGHVAYVTLCCPDGHQRAFQVKKLVDAAFFKLVDPRSCAEISGKTHHFIWRPVNAVSGHVS